MPELPEAETIARSLAPRLQGRIIVSALFHTRRAVRGTLPPLAGRAILRVGRRGKQILLELDQGCVCIRLGMTGCLLLDTEPGPYTRAELVLNDGRLCFNDIRQFGWFGPLSGKAGPDPLEISSEEFSARLRLRRSRVKSVLLDQGFVRGLGNIYADEALFRAGIHPLARTARISDARARKLHAAIVEVLNEAIARGGSSISNYVDAMGRRGGFQAFHRVYRKQGKPCPRCGTPIRRIVAAQRGTHYCPRCQRP